MNDQSQVQNRDVRIKKIQSRWILDRGAAIELGSRYLERFAKAPIEAPLCLPALPNYDQSLSHHALISFFAKLIKSVPKTTTQNILITYHALPNPGMSLNKYAKSVISAAKKSITHALLS